MWRRGCSRIVDEVGREPTSTIEEHVMNLRTTAVTAIAVTMLAVPAGLAAASPLPDPPPGPSTTVVFTDARAGRDATLVELRRAYRTASWPGKRGLHNEIVLLLERRDAAL